MRAVTLVLLLAVPQPLLAAEPAETETRSVPPPAGETRAGEGRAADATEPVPPIATAIAGPQLIAEDLRVGSGVDAVPGSMVAVHYTGWLQDRTAPGHKGRQFDSSRGRRVFVFPLGAGRVIKGWDLGVTGMKVGGLRRLTIPPELGYGGRDLGGGLIPANSTLVFEVELLGVETVTDTVGAR
jgi:FKBP-type peptidyl-prolyl cis-trans isomerase